ncbi:tetratricopeptide repeat protein [Rhodococcus tibetensis]|uniref:Tetratricopeptide repeat protein n=1 Tax=Rhodococcus tibetensis TaxID=2965064 RepID=A0ABT1QI24_9NOCA|nr:tetratricopeptide repeat protein [Rhodococcus sp. FXJ9.536]MCQ4121832.1 tetratricopeptide repeat protein [Rhodococcus sp. FXJ9.536]
MTDHPLSPDEARDLLAAGGAAYARGDLTAARDTFEQVARTASDDLRISAMINAASMSDELGDHVTAVDRYREALAAMSADARRIRPVALINLSQTLQHVGDLDGAQTALEQARSLLTGHDDLEDLRIPCLLSLTAVAIHRQQWAYAADLAHESLGAAVHSAPHLAGHPLMNLAAVHFETGRFDLADDFAGQALAAFAEAGDNNAVAETQQNLGIQTHFEQAGVGHRVGIGLKVLAFVAERRDQTERASALYRRSAQHFADSGALLDVADVNTRLATLAFGAGRRDEGEALLASAVETYAELGLGLHCAQVDVWHATLLEAMLNDHPDPALRKRAVDLAVPAALTVNAVRYTLPNGFQREQWNRHIADPAMALAFRLSYGCGDALLVSDLIEAQCAGTTLDLDRSTGSPAATLPLVMPALPDHTLDVSTAFQLGTALAGVAAGVGLPVCLPPQLTVSHGGRVALEPHIAMAEKRYGHPVRDGRSVPAW